MANAVAEGGRQAGAHIDRQAQWSPPFPELTSVSIMVMRAFDGAAQAGPEEAAERKER